MASVSLLVVYSLREQRNKAKSTGQSTRCSRKLELACTTVKKGHSGFGRGCNYFLALHISARSSAYHGTTSSEETGYGLGSWLHNSKFELVDTAEARNVYPSANYTRTWAGVRR